MILRPTNLCRHRPRASGLFAYWPLDDGAHTTARQLRPIVGWDGTVTNGTWVGGRHGRCIDLSGSGSRIVIDLWQCWGTEVPGGFTNTGLALHGDYLYCADYTNQKVVKMSKLGVDQSSDANADGSGIQGVAYDDSDDTLWYVNYDEALIRHMQLDGTQLASIDISGQSITANSLAYDSSDDTLWVVPPTGTTAYQYDASDGSYDGNISLSGASGIDGLAYNSTDDAFITSSTGNDRVMGHNKSTGAKLWEFKFGNIAQEHLCHDPSDESIYVNFDSETHSAVPDGNRFAQYTELGVPTDRPALDHYTMSIWFRLDSMAANAMLWEIYDTGNIFMDLYVQTTGSLRSLIPAATTATGLVTTATWYHAVTTYDGSTFNIYLNGKEVKSVSGSRTAYGQRYLVLGARGSNGGYSLPVNGRLSRAALFDYALTAEEVGRLYAITDGLIAGRRWVAVSPNPPIVTDDIFENEFPFEQDELVGTAQATEGVPPYSWEILSQTLQ